MKDNGDGPGQFSWLRWRAANNAGNATELRDMMAEDGNLAGGFDEGIFKNGTFTWPDPNSQPPTVGGKVVYPVKPHEINTGDFVYGNSGVSISSAVEASLKYHIDRRTVLILPIVEQHVKVGGDTFFQVTGLGAFYLMGIPGYGTGSNVNGGGANSFFDLAYIGSANAVACLSTPAVVSNTLGVTGSVFVKPRWGLQQAQQPIAYEIIMDVSGSMSWNFLGQGSTGGTIRFEADSTGSTTTRQCEATAANPNSYDCGAGATSAWKKVTERRIYVVKQALAGPGGFIENMKPNDTMRIVTFSTDGINKGPGWTSDQTALKNTVMLAGSYNGDRYRTSGGTPGPKAIKGAGEVLDNEPPPAPTNGQSFKHVVIYMTDGVANIWLNGNMVYNYATDVCPQYGGDSRAINDVWCQYDKQGYPAHSRGPRPISSMIIEAGKIKDKHPEMQFFTVAVAQVNPLGLDEVATSPKHLYLATDAGLVSAVLDQIYDKVIGPCTETGTTTWINKIDDTHRADSPPMPALPSGVYGYVYLTNDLNQPVEVVWSGPGSDPRGASKNMIPIVTDMNGNLTYNVPAANGLAPGTYHVTGYVNYKAADDNPTEGGDGKSRQYSRLMQDGLPVQNIAFTLTPSEVLGASVVVDPLRLDLNLNVDVCK
jgi:hypothetical protein